MYGYIFETTNTKTGETYIGKRYAVAFDKNYFGDDKAVVDAVEKYGKSAFSVKMIIPAESPEQLEALFEEMSKASKPAKKAAKKEEAVVEEPKAEPEPKPTKRKKSTKTED